MGPGRGVVDLGLEGCARDAYTLREAQVWELMRRWRKPILKARIPGAASARPMKAALDAAKSAVLRFYAREAPSPCHFGGRVF